MFKSHNPSIRRDILQIRLLRVGFARSRGDLSRKSRAFDAHALRARSSDFVLAVGGVPGEKAASRAQTAILILFVGFATTGMSLIVLIAKNWNEQWFTFQAKAPEYFSGAVAQINDLEAKIKAAYPFMHNLNLAESLSSWG